MDIRKGNMEKHTFRGTIKKFKGFQKVKKKPRRPGQQQERDRLVKKDYVCTDVFCKIHTVRGQNQC